MNGPLSNDQRRLEVEKWWALVSKILGFFMGALLVGYEALFASSDTTAVRLLLVAAGIGLMGPVVAASVASIMSSLRRGQP